MGNTRDVYIVGLRLYFLPVETRVPLKFDRNPYMLPARVSL